MPFAPATGLSATSAALANMDAGLVLVSGSGITTAGFGPSGLVALQSRAASGPQGYEDAFSTEPLLGDPGLVRAVFFAGERSTLIPPALHEKATAERWMESVHGPGTWIHSVAKSAGPVALCEVPPTAAEAAERYFANAKCLPLSLVHLSKAPPTPALLRLTVVDGLVLITAFQKGALLRQICEQCASAEDIAFSAVNLAREVGLPADSCMIVASAARLTDARLLNDAKEYLPNLEVGDAPPVAGAIAGSEAAEAWKPVVHLMYLLYACAL